MNKNECTYRKFGVAFYVILLALVYLIIHFTYFIKEGVHTEEPEVQLNVSQEVEQEEEVDSFNSVYLPMYEFTEEEIYMLSQCVEAEAGKYSEAPEGQKYVTQVILNRLHSSQYPDTLEGVIFQKKGNVPQFSVAYDGRMMNIDPEPETFNSVYSTIVHGTDLPEYVLFFYAEGVTNNWVNTLSVYNIVDGTVFAYK